MSTSVEKQATNLDRRQHSQDTQKSYQFSVEIVEDVRFYFIFVHLVFLVKLYYYEKHNIISTLITLIVYN